MTINNIAIIGSGAMGQTMASLFLDKKRYASREYPTFNISLWEYNDMYRSELEAVLEGPEQYKNLKHIFFNFGEYKDRVKLYYLNPDNDYKKSLQEAVKGKGLIIISTSTEGLEQVCSSISNSIKQNAYVLSVCKGVVESENLEIKTKLTTPYEIMEHYLPLYVKIAVGGGGNISKEIRDFKEAIFTIFSDRFTTQDMQIIKGIFTIDKFTAKEGKNRLLNEVLWASKNPYAIGAGIVDTLENSKNIMGDYIAASLREIKAIYKKMLIDRFSRFKILRFGRDFINEGVIADLLTTCYSEDSRNFRTGKYLAEGKSLDEIHELLGRQVAEGVPSTKKFLKLFENNEIEVPILHGISEVISGEKKVKEVRDNIINLLREYESNNRFSLLKHYRGRKIKK